jgi:hypothetical protein
MKRKLVQIFLLLLCEDVKKESLITMGNPLLKMPSLNGKNK